MSLKNRQGKPIERGPKWGALIHITKYENVGINIYNM